MSLEYKGYLIEPNSFGSLKEINYKGKGSVNLVLRGTYTDINQAKKAIDIFLSQKGELDGERTSTS